MASNPSKVKLPSLQEMVGERLFQLTQPTHMPSPTLLSNRVAENALQHRAYHETVIPHPPATQQYPTTPQLTAFSDSQHPPVSRSHTTSTSPLTPRDAPVTPNNGHYESSLPFCASYQRKQCAGQQDKRHVCSICGKAFNRPSSLAIHGNIHSDLQPYECPFPGCGRRFNVKSNMRRHFRNHLSPSRQTISSPYIYPLTTSPRSLPTMTREMPVGHEQGSVHAARSRARTMSVYSSSQCTDSSDEEESSFKLRPSTSFDFDAEVGKASDRVNRLRLRSRSSPGVRPANEPAIYPSLSTVCNVPGCHCTVVSLSLKSES